MQRTNTMPVFDIGSSNATAARNVNDELSSNDSCSYDYQRQHNPNGLMPIINIWKYDGILAPGQCVVPSPFLTVNLGNYQPEHNRNPNEPSRLYRSPLVNSHTGDINIPLYITYPSTQNYQPQVVSLPQEGINIKSNASNGVQMMKETLNVPNNTDFKPYTMNLIDMNQIPDDYQPNKPIFESLGDAAPDAVMKFIVDTCMTGEFIADRNQYRPCFKNIQNVCIKTRSNISNPKSTLANIHSQGIPWATKDFIIAFTRLANTSFTLKGYLNLPSENLGKVESVLTPAFRKCFYDWEQVNKKMIGYLGNAFITLDNIMTQGNARIYSAFHGNFERTTSAQNLQRTSINREESTKASNAQAVLSTPQMTTPVEEIVGYHEVLTLKGILSSDDESYTDDSDDTDKEDKPNQQYINSANFSSPKTASLLENETKPDTKSVTDKTATSIMANNDYECDLRDSESLTQANELIWQNAISKLIPFMETEMKKDVTTTDTFISNNNAASYDEYMTAYNTYGTGSDMHAEEDFRNLNSAFASLNCYNNEPMLDSIFSSTKKSGLSASSKKKFENIIDVLLELELVKYITAAADNGKISENYKYINKPIYLYQIKDNLTLNKYMFPEQIVHDIKSIVNEVKYWNKEVKDVYLVKLRESFSRELKFQLEVKFPMSDFSDIRGESPRTSLFAHHGTHAA